MKRAIVEELHKQARKHFTRRRTYVKGIDDIWQADLVEMIPYARANNGYKYILNVIDVLSKYAWAVPVRDKSAKSVTEAMRDVFTLSSPRLPTNLQTDNGKEFYNKDFALLMKRHGINHYSTFSTMKAAVVERLNKSFKHWTWEEFSVQGNYKWLKLLPKLLQRYNTRVHRSTGMRPVDVSVKEERNLINKLNKPRVGRKVLKFSVGDVVRISKYKTTFAKGYTPSWSTELFTVDGIRPTRPPVYYLRDYQGNAIRGGFYELELQKTKYNDTYLVEKVIKRRGNKVYVKSLGFDSMHNSWV